MHLSSSPGSSPPPTFLQDYAGFDMYLSGCPIVQVYEELNMRLSMDVTWAHTPVLWAKMGV